MFRIDSTDSVDGRFDDGDEGVGREGTVVTDDWLNALQAELIAPIRHAGIDLNKYDNGQLLQAILAIVAPCVPRTGQIILDSNPEPMDGWVFFDDGSIGPPNSGATTRANNDVQSLYFMFWEHYSNGVIPISGGGRGASALADWEAGRTLLLPRLAGRALAVVGHGSGLSNRSLGAWTGNEQHQLSQSQLPKITPSTTKQIGVSHGDGEYVDYLKYSTDGHTEVYNFYQPKFREIGGNQPHNNMQPTSFVMARVKL